MPSLLRLAEQYGAPYFLYDESVIAAQWRLLREALPDFGILYSIKTNPHPDVCRCMRVLGAGADAASAGEVQKALAVGFAPRDILYSAPGKSDAALGFCMESSLVIADSYGELERIDALAAEAGRVVDVGLRVNPGMSFSPGAWPEVQPGVAAKFGVDEESLEDRLEYFRSLSHVRVRGIHVFLRSQVLSQPALVRYFGHVFDLARRCRAYFEQEPEFINFGGGFGVAVGEWRTPLDVAALGGELRMLAARERRSFPVNMRLLVESGRFLVGRAGTFITRIADVKQSRGTTWVIVPGALNGFFRPALMNLLNALPGDPLPPLEPLYSNGSAHRVSLPELENRESRPIRKVTVCGCLCTGLDVLARDVSLPDPRVGDILAVDNAGAYAATLSPHSFSGFERPAELFVDEQGVVSA